MGAVGIIFGFIVFCLIVLGIMKAVEHFRKCDKTKCTDEIGTDGKKCQKSMAFWNKDYPRCTCNGGDPCATGTTCTKDDTAGTGSCIKSA